MKAWEVIVIARKEDFPQEVFRWVDLGFFGMIWVLEKIDREVRFLEGKDYGILEITIRRKREEMPNL